MAKRGRKKIHFSAEEVSNLNLRLEQQDMRVGDKVLHKDTERVVEKIYSAGSHWYIEFSPLLIVEAGQFSFLAALGYFKRP